MTPRYVDPVLLAVSDCLVMTALERATSRVVPRSARGELGRHRVHESVAIYPDRIDRALHGAWELCGELAARHSLRVDVEPWAARLDDYARALLLMSVPHEIPRLAEYLAAVGVDRPGARAYLAVAT